MDIRVLIATGLYPPEIGGPATYAKMLEEELPQAGIAVEVLPFGTVRSYPKLVRHLIYTWRLWQASKDVAVIYALDPVSVGWPARITAQLRGTRLILRLGGDYAWEQGCARFDMDVTLDAYRAAPKRAPLPVRVLDWLQRTMAQGADTIVVPSKYLKSIVEQWGVAPEKIQVIYSVLFPLSVPADRGALRNELGYQYPTIVSAGRLVPWKGFAALIAVVRDLKTDYPNLQLIIAGEGSERAKLEALIREYELEDSVRLVGSLSKDVLGATIKAADVFVLNTAYEGLSHQLLEVMDLEVPVVTTNVGGNPELIVDGVTGRLVPPDDHTALQQAITATLEQPAETRQQVTAAKARTKDFAMSVSISRIKQLLYVV